MKKAKIKVLSYTLAASVLLGSTALTAGAAPVAGVSSVSSVSSKNSGYTTFAGVNLLTTNMLADANTQAAVSDNATATVAEAAPVSEYANIAIAQVNDYVNIRSIASEEGEVLGKLYNNSAATIEATEGDWYKITSGTVTGYVKAEYIVAGNEELARSVSRKEATVTTQTLYVRSEASTEAAILGMVAQNDTITVTDDSMKDQGWVKVSIEEGEGYVSIDYITTETIYTVAESKEEEAARLAKEEAERQAAAAAAAKKAARKSAAASVSTSSSSSNTNYVAPTGGDGSSVVSYATQFVGNPYVYGGTSLTNGADCSGFVMSVYAAYGVSLPHSSGSMRSVGYGVSQSEMQPGDIVCYSGHVGIYAGNGQIVHASNSRDGIIVSSAYYKNIVAVRRIF